MNEETTNHPENEPRFTEAMRRDVIVSQEFETMTVLEGTTDEGLRSLAIGDFLSTMGKLAPSLPCGSGFFNPYGRVYLDCGDHIEFALVECDSPYLLPLIFERQQILAARAVQEMAEERGKRLILANNNHSGLLKTDAPTWGSHENYMVEEHPTDFGERILPFLVTRIWGGAGGVHYPSGRFLAGVRPLFMDHTTAGGTTERRAIHSTARDEPHMSRESKRFRYHLILGDGHRSHFNLALQAGTTALALKAAFHDPELPERLRAVGKIAHRGAWTVALKRFNRLQEPGESLFVNPLVINVQRIYLDSARRYVESLADAPAWMPQMLEDWENTINALAQLDRAWLSRRLDTFIKYELFSSMIGNDWKSVPNNEALCSRLTIADHSYHEFTSPDSIFTRLEQVGAIDHRVGDLVEPGQEEEPYIPETVTRARTRARFICEHAKAKDMAVTWTSAHNRKTGARALLMDPFAEEFGPWEGEKKPRLDPPDDLSALEIVRQRLQRRMQARLQRLADEEAPPF